MKLSLSKQNWTWGVHSLIALAVMGSLSLAQTAKATLASDELSQQLIAKGKSYSTATYKNLGDAIAAALKTPITDPYKFTGPATGLTAQKVRDLLVTACQHNAVVTDGTGAAGVVIYVTKIFAGEATVTKGSSANYPAGALSTAADVQGVIADAFTYGGAYAQNSVAWSTIAVKACASKKYSVALAQQLFGADYYGASSSLDIQAAIGALVKVDKTIDVSVVKAALSASAGPAHAQDIYLGAVGADTAGAPGIVAAAVAADPTHESTILSNVLASPVGTKLKLTNVNAAAWTASQVAVAANAGAAGAAVVQALTTGTAHASSGTESGYALYGGAKPASFLVVSDIVGAATIAKPDYANQIVASAIKTSTTGFVTGGKAKGWAVNYGAVMLDAALKNSALVSRASHSIVIDSTTSNGAAEAAAAIVEQAMYAMQTGTSAGGSGMIQKDINTKLPALAAQAIKTLLKVDMNPALAKVQVSNTALAGAEVGAIVSVTGTGANNAVAKWGTTKVGGVLVNDPLTRASDYEAVIIWNVVKTALATVKKNADQSTAILTAMSQAVGYIVGQYGYGGTITSSSTQVASLISGIEGAVTASGALLNGTVNGVVTTAFDLGASGIAGIGAYGTRDAATGNYYGTYWNGALRGGATGSPVTDITGI